MNERIVDGIIGVVIGGIILWSFLYVKGLNARITNVEQFLNRAVQQNQQAQPKPEVKSVK